MDVPRTGASAKGTKMFDARPSDIVLFEDRVVVDDSALVSALGNLSKVASGRGACMCLEHAMLGVAVIADESWTISEADTLRHRDRHTVISVRDHEGFDKVSVLVGSATESERGMMMLDCAIAAAALELVACVAIAKAMLLPVAA
jgi:hypothetical protein